MASRLKHWLSGMRSVKSRPARRAVPALEALEARENLSVFVPGTHELAPVNVQYLNGNEEIRSGAGVYYYRDGYGDVYDWNASAGSWNLMFTGAKEFAACTANGSTDYFVELGNDGTMRWGLTFANYGNTLWSTQYQNGGWNQFKVGPDGSIDSLTAGGFFAHWSSPNGSHFGGSPTTMLGNVAKFQVAPNGTVYTLQYNSNTGAFGRTFDTGFLAGWVNGSLSYGQAGVNNFAVDSYSNIVSVDGVGNVYVDSRFVGYDSLPFGYSVYAGDGTSTWLLGYDAAGNLTWNWWSPGVVQYT